MEYKLYIGILAGIFSLCGYIPYAIGVFKGKSRPERLSWTIWTLSSTLILLSYIALGARTTIWVPAAYVLGTGFITILSFLRGQHGWGLLERISLVVALISSIRWVVFDNVFFVLIINLVLSFISYVRTIKWLFTRRTKQEDVSGWGLYVIGATLNLFAIEAWTPEIAALPIMFFVMNIVTFLLAIRNRIYIRMHPEPLIEEKRP